MLDHLGAALADAGFMPHGMCYLWQPEILWLHVISDAVIAASYYSIPFALIYFVVKRRDLVFSNMFVLFGVFILACGTTHVLGIWTVWNPDYWLDGGVKLFTATASLLTALLLWRVMPAALALPSRSQLEAANLALERQIDVREEAEATAQRLNLELERRVEERTAELEAANESLHAALHQKEVLLREVHHRVKNNLQVVVGLLTLQARHADPALLVHFQESLERLRAMGRVHEQLYRGEDSSSFDASLFIRRIFEDLSEVYGANGRIECLVEAQGDARVPLDVATPLALILNEVISNAFKHGFPGERRGRIRTTLDADPDELRLEIHDDGIGIPPQQGEARSMGLKLVRMLSRQIGAEISIEPGSGTRFKLVLPRLSTHDLITA